MDKFRKKSIKQICNEIDLIIAGKVNKEDHKYIFIHLESAVANNFDYEDINLLCETIKKIALTKHRILRYLEQNFWNSVKKIPGKICLFQNIAIEECEELLPNIDYNDSNKKILSRLLGLVQEILDLKDDKNSRSILRRCGSLDLLGELVTYYHIPFAKNIFSNSLDSKNKREQYSALQGLENYYYDLEEIDEQMINKLDELMENTNDRLIASTCLQIKIDAGLIDELDALDDIDDWKEEHYN